MFKSERFRKGSCYLLISLIAVLLYAPTLKFDFAYDDFRQISENRIVRSSAPLLPSLAAPFEYPTYPGDLYRPMTVLSYRLNFLAFGLKPIAYHSINIILHALNSCLTFAVMLPLLGCQWLSLIVALLFAIHPIHIEAVANVVGRAELLATAFGLIAMLAFSRASSAQNRRSSVAFFLLSAVCFLAAALAKESALTLLPLIAVYPLIIRDSAKAIARFDRRYTVRLIIFALIAIVIILARFFAFMKFPVPSEPARFHVENPLSIEPFISRIFPAIKVLGDYTVALLSPLQLSADYSLTFDDFWSDVYSPIGIFSVMVLLLYGLLVWDFRGSKWSFAGLWYFITFALTCNFIIPIGTIRGDRLAYLPSVGFLAFISVVLYHSSKKFGRYLHVVLFLGVAIFWGWISIERIPVWRDDPTLYAQTVKDNPRSPKAFYHLGLHFYHTAKNLEKAEANFRKALDIDPMFIMAAKYMVNISIERDDYGHAEYWFLRVLAIDPSQSEAREKLTTMKEKLEHATNKASSGGSGNSLSYDSNHSPFHSLARKD